MYSGYVRGRLCSCHGECLVANLLAGTVVRLVGVARVVTHRLGRGDDVGGMAAAEVAVEVGEVVAVSWLVCLVHLLLVLRRMRFRLHLVQLGSALVLVHRIGVGRTVVRRKLRLGGKAVVVEGMLMWVWAGLITEGSDVRVVAALTGQKGNMAGVLIVQDGNGMEA